MGEGAPTGLGCRYAAWMPRRGMDAPTGHLPRPIVVGLGPAGLFAGLVLALRGLCPLVLERGAPIAERQKDVQDFRRTRVLNPHSNVQFGEGGAGTFSDGKLNTGIKSPLCRQVLEELVLHGAPPDILVNAKPHIGTDKLGAVVQAIREEIIRLGGEVRFHTALERLIIANNSIHGVVLSSGEELECDAVFLCIGHSARDTVTSLLSQGVKMQAKPFSVGVRIEHKREWIDKAQYGSFAGHPALGAADYKMATHPEGSAARADSQKPPAAVGHGYSLVPGRGAYTFCMCPGGTVVCAASEPGGMVVNGMSEYARNGENSNSAILVGVQPLPSAATDALAGLRLQRELEQNAFVLGGGSYAAPAQTVGDFLADKASVGFGAVEPTCTTGVVPCNIAPIFPAPIVQTLRGAIPAMGRLLRGFDAPDAVLTAPESRSSSPVRILRDENGVSNILGLYPVGEGAGYAGGIVSAAVDGVKAALSYNAQHQQKMNP